MGYPPSGRITQVCDAAQVRKCTRNQRLLTSVRHRCKFPVVETFSPAFATLVPIVERLTRRKRSASQWTTWTAPQGEIRTPLNDVEGLLHELCHWIVADEKVRDQANYGLEDDSSISTAQERRQERQEKLCGWIEDALYAKAGVKRRRSSVDDVFYRRAPRLRTSALKQLAATISAWDEDAIVAALQLPGGDVCRYADLITT